MAKEAVVLDDVLDSNALRSSLTREKKREGEGEKSAAVKLNVTFPYHSLILQEEESDANHANRNLSAIILFLLLREEDWQFLVDQLSVGSRTKLEQLLIQVRTKQLAHFLAKRVIVDALLGDRTQVVAHNLAVLLSHKVI